MEGDHLWYEAAHVVGITNALNVAADGLAALPTVTALLPPVAEAQAGDTAGDLFAEIRAFYARGDVPPVFLDGVLGYLWAWLYNRFAKAA